MRHAINQAPQPSKQFTIRKRIWGVSQEEEEEEGETVSFSHQRKQYCDWHIDHSYQYRRIAGGIEHSIHACQLTDPS
jgi:hypothetical protein